MEFEEVQKKFEAAAKHLGYAEDCATVAELDKAKKRFYSSHKDLLPFISLVPGPVLQRYVDSLKVLGWQEDQGTPDGERKAKREYERALEGFAAERIGARKEIKPKINARKPKVTKDTSVVFHPDALLPTFGQKVIAKPNNNLDV